MALFKSRVLPDTLGSLEVLQLGKGITYAEEAFRSVLRVALGENVKLVQRELIVPKRRTDKQELLNDPDGIVMRGDLAEDVARRIWERLTNKQKNTIHAAVDARYHKLEDNDFEVRTVFIQATAHSCPGETPVHVVARVVAFALSGWWNMADVRLWHRKLGEPNSRYVGAEYQVDGRIHAGTEREWQPPKFLLS